MKDECNNSRSRLAAILLLASCHHPAELVFTSKFTAKLAISSNELLARGNQDLAGGDSAIGLQANQDLGDIGVANYFMLISISRRIESEPAAMITFISSHQDMRGLFKVLAEEVSQGVVFLQ